MENTMKFLSAISFLTVIVAIQLMSQITASDGMRMPGDWNGFSNNLNMGGSFDLIKNTTGTVRWQTKFQYSGVTGDQKFKFVSGGSGNLWANQWYFGVFETEDAAAMNTLESYLWTTNGAVANNKIAVTNGRWYSVNWKDNGYTASQAIFMETSSEPVTISNVTDNFLTRGSGNNGIVTITLSASKSSEEKIFVRYTTDGWATSTFVEATGSGTSYTASIPDAVIAAFNGNDEFYVLTTTVAVPTHADADMITINLNNNGGANYKLPVELIMLRASFVRNMVQLEWRTAMELDNSGFEIERKQDSRWQMVGFVEGHGTTNAPQEYRFNDKELSPGTYTYRLKQVNRDGTFDYSGEVEASVVLSAEAYALSQNFPNPFNPVTTFSFAVKDRQHVKVSVYDMIGREVATLIDAVTEPNILHKVSFDGSTLSSGVYFYALRTPGRLEIRKLMLMK
jgi:hypothetical protein